MPQSWGFTPLIPHFLALHRPTHACLAMLFLPACVKCLISACNQMLCPFPAFPRSGTSAQLLTWVVVAAVWIRDEPPNYMVFGMLGAMSAAYVTWIPGTTPGTSARR